MSINLQNHLDRSHSKVVEKYKSIILQLSFIILCLGGLLQSKAQNSIGVRIKILGTIQDAGSPHIGCKKDCCKDLFKEADATRKVVSLGLIDNINKKRFLFEATPDISSQLKMLKSAEEQTEMPDGIFLTHAHIGHYTGLMYLGKEAIDAKEVEVFTMPRMKDFLESNGPWSQLVQRKNIVLTTIKTDSSFGLTPSIKITPLQVPHRDEYSETVGYLIVGPKKKALFIPDIDKWKKWERDIVELIKEVDYAFLDATFYSGEELGHRDISEIPHPFVIESMELFEPLSAEEKAKVIFIHLNHTNPIINADSKESKIVEGKGFRIARYGESYEL